MLISSHGHWEKVQQMNVLVTGGAGYIGGALVGSLIEADHTVRVFDRQSPPQRQAHPGCDYVRGDLLDVEALAASLDDIEAVYHLAWGFYPEDPRREVEENLAGTLNLLDACRTSKVRQVIFASSAVAYGPTGDEPASETDPCRPERSTIGGPVYGITKLACERYCLAHQREGPAVTIMTIHGVFSKDRLGQFSEMIEQAKEGKDVLAVAEAGGQYARLDDAVRALGAALGRDKALGEVFNVAGSRVYRDKEIADYIAASAGSGSKVALVSDPGQALISVSVDKLSHAIGLRPRSADFLKRFIDARLA